MVFRLLVISLSTSATTLASSHRRGRFDGGAMLVILKTSLSADGTCDVDDAEMRT